MSDRKAMAKFHIFRTPLYTSRDFGKGAALGGLLIVLAVMAHAGRLAETPAAQMSPLLAVLGPGKLGLLRSQQAGSNKTETGQLAAMARAALVGYPLSHEPFLAVAAGRLRDGKALTPQDDQRLREALRRNPRSREARMLLMRFAIERSDMRDAINQIAGLNQLNSESANIILTGLGKAMRHPKQVDDAMAEMRRFPALYKPFLHGFISSPKPPSLTLRLVSQIPSTALVDREMRSTTINALVGAGAYQLARTMWASGHGKQMPGAVYSPDFRETKAPPPFNWEIMASDSGAAERDRNGGLVIEYYGRRPGLLVTQLLTLTPGNHIAKADYATLDGTPGAIALQVTCAASGTPLASLPLSAKPGPSQSVTMAFTVPAENCDGQRLAIIGRIQEMRNAQGIALKRISVNQSEKP